MMFIFGMQMMVQAQYNVFGDQMMPFIFGMARARRPTFVSGPSSRRGAVASLASSRDHGGAVAGHQQLPDHQLDHHEISYIYEAVEGEAREHGRYSYPCRGVTRRPAQAWHTALQESDEFEVPGWEDLKGAIAAF